MVTQMMKEEKFPQISTILSTAQALVSPLAPAFLWLVQTSRPQMAPKKWTPVGTKFSSTPSSRLTPPSRSVKCSVWRVLVWKVLSTEQLVRMSPVRRIQSAMELSVWLMPSRMESSFPCLLCSTLVDGPWLLWIWYCWTQTQGYVIDSMCCER